MKLKFTTTYTLEGAWYVAHCVELGVTSQGKTLEEAEKNLREAIDLYLEDAPAEELGRFSKLPLIKMLDIDMA